LSQLFRNAARNQGVPAKRREKATSRDNYLNKLPVYKSVAKDNTLLVLGGVALAGYVLYSSRQSIASGASGVAGGISDIFGGAGTAVSGLGSGVSRLSEQITRTTEIVPGTSEELFKSIKELGRGLRDVSKNAANAAGSATGAAANVINAGSNAVNAGAQALNQGVKNTALRAKVGGLSADVTKGTVTLNIPAKMPGSAIVGGYQRVTYDVKGAVSTAKAKASSLVSSVKSAASAVKKKIVGKK
jgi:hypothetical protein